MKHTFYLAAIRSFFKGLIGRVVALFERKVPVGYEDETGFHTRA
jgi:hypothetical protein